ncbi:hypothetical protein MJO28_016505 [Puccinia striiformis f. sp. tritici]|uniref:Uncharacterized protein n=1 Tax=Puccinia striiformis f. sp. tritici TaxID=168172 RepID=A0ACC0DPZ6_9BASI|nr:hypothetical protein MJO28_016505 [Puccinia striiformis f. sp. tritici]
MSPRIGQNDPPPHQGGPNPPVNHRLPPLVNLAEDGAVAAVIGAITSQIREIDLLAADGSNCATWCDFLEE